MVMWEKKLYVYLEGKCQSHKSFCEVELSAVDIHCLHAGNVNDHQPMRFFCSKRCPFLRHHQAACFACLHSSVSSNKFTSMLQSSCTKVTQTLYWKVCSSKIEGMFLKSLNLVFILTKLAMTSDSYLSPPYHSIFLSIKSRHYHLPLSYEDCRK